MSEQRLRPNGRPAPSVPVTRPVANRQVPKPPTQSYEQEDQGRVNQPQQNFSTYSEQQAPPLGGMGTPPPFSMEDDYELESGKRKKSKLLKNLLLGGLAVGLLVGILFVVMYLFNGDKEVPFVDQTAITNGDNTNPLAKDGSTSGIGSVTKEVNFDGNPVPVKWPSDVKPTRMELQLDPTTGKPVLLLVGDKEGLGTVIRSYNQSGDLSGYWVIVPDSESNTDKAQETTEQGTTEETNQ